MIASRVESTIFATLDAFLAWIELLALICIKNATLPCYSFGHFNLSVDSIHHQLNTIFLPYRAIDVKRS